MQYTHLADAMYYAQPTFLEAKLDELMMQIAIQYLYTLRSYCYASKLDKTGQIENGNKIRKEKAT